MTFFHRQRHQEKKDASVHDEINHESYGVQDYEDPIESAKQIPCGQ